MLHSIIYDAITAVTFILILGLLVLIHELGHFATARLFNVRVEEFGIGFPPRVFPRRARAAQLRDAGKTIYSLNALPLGGFVRLAGENGVGLAESAGASRIASLSGGLATEDDPGAFATKPAWQRAIVLAAGAFNNMVFAMLLVFFMFAVIGTPHVGIAITGVVVSSPAAQAGIQPGDLIHSINGVVPADQADVQNAVEAHRGQPVTLVLARGSRLLTVQLAPRLSYPCDQGPIGVLTNPVDEHYVPTGFSRAATTALGVPGAVVSGIAGLVSGAGASGAGTVPRCVPVSTYQTFGGRLATWLTVPPAPGAVQEDPCVPQSGGGGVAGPIGIVRQVGCEVNNIPTQGLVPLLSLVVELSATLAVINLLPVPALDGGRLLFVLISVVARRRVRPEVEGLAHALGMLALLSLMFFISYQDVLKLLANKPAF